MAKIEELAPGLGWGTPPPPWQAIAARPLLILVGVTGVGKTTTRAALQTAGLDFSLLPNRRTLTDTLIIAYLQRMDGRSPHPVTDRAQRFAYTRRYRELHPGGMAHALAQLWVDPRQRSGLLLFDGLRGENEVCFAAQQLPQAQFVVLDAPDAVRVRRLLGRQDAFDHVARAALETPVTAGGATEFADLGVPEAKALFTAAEAKSLLSLVRRAEVTADELRAKLRIVVAERRNYDPGASITALHRLAPERTLVVDTTTTTPQETAQQVLADLERAD